MQKNNMIMVEKDNEIIIDPFSPASVSIRTARFLTPTISHSSSFDLPVSAFLPRKSVSMSKDCFKNVKFSGWIKQGVKNWKEWVNSMKTLHESTWQKAGIYQAIMNSTMNVSIASDKNLIMGLVEKWCPLTSSFVFPWGEATVSLEDVVVLSSYSVLGDTVRIQPDDGDTEVLSELTRVRGELYKLPQKKTTMSGWTREFMGKGGNSEHVAFLVLWLSRHVFPFTDDVVGKHLHAMAVQLARGRKIALAPAVLACIYRDLAMLKQAIVSKNKNKVQLWSHMHLLQIWAWERIPTLRPQPNPRIKVGEPRMDNPRIEEGEPMIYRWNKATTKWELEHVRSVIDSASKSFVWRPYAKNEKCWKLHKFYSDKEKWVSVSPGMHDDFKSFAKVVRASELVGINSIEPYYPHRVAMQYGMDQDIPGIVAGVNESPEIAWKNYDEPIRDEKLYVPSRSLRSGVTRQYLEWWEQMKLVKKNEKDSKKRKTVMKKKKAIFEETNAGCKKLKVDKSVSTSKGAVIEYPKKGRSGKRLKRSDWGKIPDDCILSLGVEFHEETENDKQSLKAVDRNKISDDCKFSSSAELHKEIGSDEQPAKVILDDDRLSRLACNGDNLQTESRLEPTEVVHSNLGEPVNEVPMDKFCQHDEPQIPSSSQQACDKNHDGQKSNMDPTNVVDKILWSDETGKNIVDGDRFSQKQSLAMRDNAVVEDAAKWRVSIGGDSGAVRNKNQTESNTNSKSEKLKMLRAKPLEERISRLERLAPLIKEMIRTRSPGVEFKCKTRGSCLVNIPNKHFLVSRHKCSYKTLRSTCFSATQVIRGVEKETFDGDQISITMKELR